MAEAIDIDPAYRRLIGPPMNDPVWDPAGFTKNRDRLLESDIAERFFNEIPGVLDRSGMAGDEHFRVFHNAFRTIPKDRP